MRDEKTKLFRSLRPFPLEELYDYLVLAQYEAGEIDGKPVPAYRAEPGVDPSSLAPTFATMKVFVDNWRWQGVPFYLTSGKRLTEKLTRIVIHFREVPHSLFRRVLGEDIQTNRLVLDIQPKEEITLYFQAKRPGAQVALRTVRLHFPTRTRRQARGWRPMRRPWPTPCWAIRCCSGGKTGWICAGPFWTRCWRPARAAATGPTGCIATGPVAGGLGTRPSCGPATLTTTR